MGKLEKLRPKPSEEWQVERFSRWLHEWELLQVPPEEETPAEEVGAKSDALLEACVAPPDLDFEPGQIRLLFPRGLDSELVFIVIAGVSEEQECTCVPFSPLSEPATPDELLSGRDEPTVRVFCLWNARTVPAHLLPESWTVDTLTETELNRLSTALDGCGQTGQVPDRLKRDAGPPLSHPEDPRREYRYREKQRLDHALVRESATSHNVIEYDITPAEDRQLPKAAEDHDEYEV
jgi:hypothetical protein